MADPVSFRGEWRPVRISEALALGAAREQIRPVTPYEQVGTILSLAAWHEAALGDGWIAAYRFSQQGGRIIIAEVRIFPDSPASPRRPKGLWSGEFAGNSEASVPSGGLTARVLRRATPGKHLRIGRNAAEALKPLVPDKVFRQIMGAAASEGISKLPMKRESKRGRKPLADRELVRVAAAYDATVNGPAKRARPLAEELAKLLKLSPSTVRNRIYQARDRGFLERAPLRQQWGVASGRLTEKGRLLRDAIARAERRHRNAR